MNFEEELKERVRLAETSVLELLPDGENETTGLAEAMKYSMQAGGKRIRPVLMESVHRLFGGKSQALPYFMAAIEMIHTHSLIHDDLPALDNDVLRRGKPTLHIAYGEAAAILAGDALLNFAYETAYQGILKEQSRTDEKGRQAMRNAWSAFGILLKKTGIFGMLGGQSVDVENEKNTEASMTKEKLAYIYEKKTGALLEASLMIGALLGGASEEEVAGMEAIGRKIGMAFQIQDDILDVTGNEAEIGKPAHSDEKLEKITMVTFLGIEGAGEEAVRLTNEALACLEKQTGNRTEQAFLSSLLLWLVQRRS